MNVTPIPLSEAMRITGRSKRTIDRWIKDGHLHPVDLGGFDGVIVAEEELLRAEKQMRDHLKESRATGPKFAA